jgi:hypothetical protein
VATKLAYKRWINWDVGFLEEVKKEGSKDQDYVETLKSLGEGGEKKENTLHQEEGVLYHKLRLLVPCSLRKSVLEKRTPLDGSRSHGTG